MNVLAHLVGKTRARLLYDPAGRAIFEGHLNIEVPKGARLVRSGYAAVMSPVCESFHHGQNLAGATDRLTGTNLRS